MFQGQPIPFHRTDHRHQLRRSCRHIPPRFARRFRSRCEGRKWISCAKWVNGKIVLVGTDAVEDRYATPFYTPFSGPNWTTAGVEIHANTMRTLLERRYLLPVPAVGRALALLLAAASRSRSRRRRGRTPRAAGFHLDRARRDSWLRPIFCSNADWILSTSEMLVAASICLIASIVYRFSTAEKRGKLFHRAVALFVGKQLASSLEETETIALSGKRLDVTILFTDIRGFTAFTEKVCDEQGPEVVVQLLNEYMATMVGIIVNFAAT